MAIEVTKTRVDDLDGRTKTGVQPVHFSFDGVDYTIDLSPSNTRYFHRTVAKFINAARPATVKATSQYESHPETAAIRAFGRANGYAVADRGRLGLSLVAAYEAAKEAERQAAESAEAARFTTSEAPPAGGASDRVPCPECSMPMRRDSVPRHQRRVHTRAA